MSTKKEEKNTESFRTKKDILLELKFALEAIYSGIDVLEETDRNGKVGCFYITLHKAVVCILKQVSGNVMILSFNKDCQPDIAAQVFYVCEQFWKIGIGRPVAVTHKGIKQLSMNERIYPPENTKQIDTLQETLH